MEFPRQAAFYIKRGDGWQIQREGFQVEHLGPVPDGGQLEPFLITILPGNEYDSSPVSHPGEEFIYCLQGEIEYCLGENSYYLSPGDSLLFQAMHPHNWRNMSAKPAVLLLVFQAAQDNSLARQRHRTG
jgi:quercetin dioxygenase-like cupin family protein